MRKLASIQKILEVKNHPNADRLDLVKVLGWQCVTRRDEFKVGDLVCYIEIDSMIPIQEWSAFLDKKGDKKPARLRTVRLRKELSQGIVFPTSTLFAPDFKFVEGEDVTDLLGITLYVPEIPACLRGDIKGSRPSFIFHTDELRVQAYPEIVNEFMGKKVYIAQKIDGTSSSFAYRDGEFFVCSRNLSLKENADNTYWKMARKYDIENKLINIFKETGGLYCLQAECAGMGIQSNPMGLSDVQLFAFNVIDLNAGRYLDFNAFKVFCNKYNFPIVPILMEDVEYKWTIEEILALANTFKYPNGKVGEGIVIRPMQEFYSDVLKSRASFKAISNDYLEKHED